MRDVVRLLALVAAVVLAFVAVRFHHVNLLEVAFYRDLAGVPRWVASVSRVVVWFGSPAAIAVTAGIAFYLRRLRLGLCLVGAGTLGWLAGHLTRVFAASRTAQVTVHGQVETLRVVFPADHMAVAAALFTFASAYLPRRLRRLVPLVVVLVAVAEDITGHQLALDIIAGSFIGWAMSTLVALIAGAPGRSVSADVVRQALAAAGLEPERVTVLHAPMHGPRHFEVVTSAGETLMVELVRRGQRRAGLTYKLRHLLASVDVADEPGLSSPRHEVDHEALVSLLAERAGVRTPRVVLAGGLGHGPALLVRAKVEGCRLSELGVSDCPDSLLDAIWQQVCLLGQAHIAHHDLRAGNLLIDEDGRPWVLDFTFAKAGAPPRRLAQDVAETLVSLTSVVGAERAIASAVGRIGPGGLGPALAYLQPLALPSRIREQLHERSMFLDLAEGLAAELDAARPSFRPQVRARALISLAFAGGAVYVLLPQLGTVPSLVAAVEHANYWWLVAAVAAGAATFASDAGSYMGASRASLPFVRTTLVQVASAFTSRLTPFGVGGIALNLVYLRRQGGGDRAEAVGSVALNQAAGAVVHGALFFIAAAVLGTSGLIGKVKLPTGWPVLVAVVAVLVAVGLAVGFRFGRRRLVEPTRRVARNLLAAMRNPARALGLFAGSAGVTMFNGLALAASLAAFDSHVPLVSVLAVYTGGAAIASAAPTPGNLGAVEAALAAGLTGIGIASAPAVAAVLAFRLLTFWLPILPGLAVLRYLEHRGVI